MALNASRLHVFIGFRTIIKDAFPHPTLEGFDEEP